MTMTYCGKCRTTFTTSKCPTCVPKKTKRRLSVGNMVVASSSSSAAASSSSSAAAAAGRQRLVAPGYALIHTLGRCRIDAHGGDGAYANWLQRYFQAVIGGGQTNCRYIDRLSYTGPVGNANARKLASDTNPRILSEFKRVLESPALATIDTIILNWHIRYTGTPNGYTGRGLSQTLLGKLHAAADAAGKRLLIVYTVHENSNVNAIARVTEQPTGLITLNPSVHSHMQGQFPADAVQGMQSQVPGLMTSVHTTVLSHIYQYLGFLDPPTLPGIARPSNPTPVPTLKSDGDDNLNLAIMVQEFRLRISQARQIQVATPTVRSGIVLFGMISARHGTTVANVSNLCAALTRAGIDNTFHVIVAGKEEEEDLVTALRDLAKSTPRLKVPGLLGSFDELAHCQYALSFDPHGFRSNASAMINVIRAGHLLFSRNSGESDEQLVIRAVQAIANKKKDFNLTRALADQIPRCIESEEHVVGRKLEQFFDSIAARSGPAFVDTSLHKVLGEPEEDEAMASSDEQAMILNFQANEFPLHNRPNIRLRVSRWTEPDGDCGIHALGLLAGQPFTRASLAAHLRSLGTAEANAAAASFTGPYQTRWLSLQQMSIIGRLLGFADIALVGFNTHLANTWSELEGNAATSQHIIAHVPAALGAGNNHWVVMVRR
ncbi:hypothetical protein [Duganella sp. HH101]|uniref:hypothetical protein n=1 Tax=Duganella sp. HH101 TaxID=1781066 RepID=UPI000892C0EA|nr:hypothetical protein [Duganella sp. HH101]OEZ98927.1 hypothetical protein DUGA2_54700 [Duganella sp. HH101]